MRRSLETMSTAYFSMVMATGILSLAAHLLRVPVLPRTLYALNWLLFINICMFALARACWHARQVLMDVADHLRGPGFFTFVAACGVLGSQCLVIGGSLWLAIALGLLGLFAWLVLTYGIFAVFTVKEDKPSLDAGINGGWLLAVVATQSMAMLAGLIAAVVPQPLRLDLNFFALSMWLWGGMLYIWMMSLIFYRYTFFRFSPDDLSPPYWINMGAMAISALVGSLLIINAPHAHVLASLLPFLKGFTVFYWATGTWWIPMLAILAVWRHGVKRFPFRYDPLYWGAVFPLGMYAASTARLSEAMQVRSLHAWPGVFLGIGLLAWAVVFFGQLRALGRNWIESAYE